MGTGSFNGQSMETMFGEKGMKNKIAGIAAVLVIGMTASAGCQRYEPITESSRMIEDCEGKEGDARRQDTGETGKAGSKASGNRDPSEAEAGGNPEILTAAEQALEGRAGDSRGSDGAENGAIVIRTAPERTPVKVKGIYVSAYAAGTEAMMDEIIRRIDETELNAVVIDVKDDNGRVTFNMDAPSVQEIGACVNYIPDMAELAAKLKEHGIYMIARIPAFRDPYLADAKPEWCCKLADGTIFRDRNQLAWVNPYKKEVWEYLIEIAGKAGEAGFDEIQFDYIRFCTEKGMNQVVFEETDTKGRSRQEIILEFTQYAYQQLSRKGLFVSADVFGAVIGGGVDAEAVGQDYREMAGRLDYICPMIYPSHYGDGNFGIPHPDTQPYDTVMGALTASKEDLRGRAAESAAKGNAAAAAEGNAGADTEGNAGADTEGNAAAAAESVVQADITASDAVSRESSRTERAAAVVRPWLQDFTASYLKHHIQYGPEQVRQQIQAVYDAGYEEWILWSAAVNYHYDGLLPAEEIREGEPAKEGLKASEPR